MDNVKSDGAKRAAVLAALDIWIRRRAGLEFGNYGDVKSYRAELRGITRDLQEARKLLRAVELSGMPAECLEWAFQRSFSGRLSWDGAKLEYCVGQYYPTEYRAAACAVLAGALWSYRREGMTGEDVGIRLRKGFRKEFGRGIASRWFR